MSAGLAVPKPVAPAWLTLRLGFMFVLETASGAAYVPLLSLYMRESLKLSPYEMSLVYATGPVMSLIAPLLVGFVADRVLPAEKSLAFLNLVRSLALFFATRAHTFPELLMAMALVGFCATPSAVLNSAIGFHHLPDAKRFGHARVWGTASWMAALWVMSAYLSRFSGQQQLAELVRGLELASLLTLLLGLYAFTLPHTPAATLGRGALEGLAALDLLKQREFLVLFVVSVASGALFQMNLILQALFYTSSLGLDAASTNRASSISQVLELALFPSLFLLLSRFGLRRVLIAGIAAWPLRFLVNWWGQPAALVVGVQLLHGLNVVLGAFALQIAADELAPAGRRASTHALLATGSAGVGALLGQLASGWLLSSFGSGNVYQWRAIFLGPLAIGASASLLLLFGFRRTRAV